MHRDTDEAATVAKCTVACESHLTYNAKKKILELYGLEQEATPEEIRKQIKILLTRDWFTCASERREVSRVAWKTQLRRSGSNEIQSCGFRFRAQEAIEFIHREFYNGPKKLGNQDKNFIAKISAPFICLIFTVLCHNLQCYETGEYVMCEDFNYSNSNSE